MSTCAHTHETPSQRRAHMLTRTRTRTSSHAREHTHTHTHTLQEEEEGDGKVGGTGGDWDGLVEALMVGLRVRRGLHLPGESFVPALMVGGGLMVCGAQLFMG